MKNNPKRYQSPKIDSLEGRYNGGILNQSILTLYGTVVSQWTHIEELMIEVLEWLLFLDENIIRQVARKSRGHKPGRQIFRSIGTHNYRIKLMRNLLSRFIGNVEKDPLYDEIIDDFAALGEKRNDYVHSKWWTHESGRAFMQQQLMETFTFGTKEEINAAEFIYFLHKTQELKTKIQKLSEIEHREIMSELLNSLPQTLPPPPAENSQ
jgi:hypothetical protein